MNNILITNSEKIAILLTWHLHWHVSLSQFSFQYISKRYYSILVHSADTLLNMHCLASPDSEGEEEDVYTRSKHPILTFPHLPATFYISNPTWWGNKVRQVFFFIVYNPCLNFTPALFIRIQMDSIGHFMKVDWQH